MSTPHPSDMSSDDEPGPSTRRHMTLSTHDADPDVLAPIVDSSHASKRVHYYHSPLIGSFSYGYGHPMKPYRMRMTHSLVTAYGLDKCMVMREPKEADKVDMTRFHSDEYVDFLERVNPENGPALTGQGSRFLVGEDCPPFPSVFQFCSLSSGGSISAASSLNTGAADIAVNWAGGLHHAKKREASGFCYTNDIVLGILELLRVHPRVLYIDVDIHHGDGVEEAFYSTNRVLSVSFHKFGDFFPGTGDVRDVGIGEGKGYAVNVPLRDGVGDDSYHRLLFEPVIRRIMEWYRPGAVVLQCGADSLAGDKLGCFNLSMKGHAACVSFLQSFNVPLMCVGGGGYTVRNVARTWTYETALLLGREPDEDLPFNEYMNWFGPEYKLDVRPTSMENLNTEAYLEGLRSRIIDNLRNLPFAPSVAMQPTPAHALNAHAEAASGEDDEYGYGDGGGAEEEGEPDAAGGTWGELEKRIQKNLDRIEVQRRIDTPMSESDDSAGEEHDHRQPAPALQQAHRDRLHRLLSRGNGALEARSSAMHRSLLSEDGGAGAASSSAAGSTTPWYSNIARPPRPLSTAIASGSGSGSSSSLRPPEALRRILATTSRRRGRYHVNGSFDTDDEGSVRSSDDEEEDDDSDAGSDESMDEDENDDRSYVGRRRRRRRRRSPPLRVLTKVGRPRRSFFDCAKPYEPWSGAGAAASGGAQPLNVNVNGGGEGGGGGVVVQEEAEAQAEAEANAAAAATAVVAGVGEEDLERARELERGRRGEGGGSEVNGANASADVEMA